MLVDNYRKDFMDKLIGHRVIIIAHQDVDAACTVKILTNVFKTEGVSYVLLSCSTISDMQEKYDEYIAQSNIFLLINCGASVDLLETLGNPPAEKKFFIIDYHRPINIINYYNTNEQICLVSGPEPEEEIPTFDQVFNDDPDVSETDSDTEDSNDRYKESLQMKKIAKRQELRRKRSLWLYERKTILFDYMEYSYYARPSSLHALEVAWAMSRDDMDSIWCAVVALTDGLMSKRFSMSKYMEYTYIINNLISHIKNARNEKLPRSCLKLHFEPELNLCLYRNWNIYESFKVTPYTGARLKIWSPDGIRQLHRLFAMLGLPLAEAKQKYLHMSLDLKQQLVNMFSSKDAKEKFHLPNMVFGSFVAEVDYRAKFNPLDVQLAILAVMEDPDFSKSDEIKFLEALQVLDVRDIDSFNKGVEKAKLMLQQLSNEVHRQINRKELREDKPYVYAQLSDSLVNRNFFRRPSSMPLLISFLQYAGVHTGKRHWPNCPWILLIPHCSNYFFVVGVHPRAYTQVEGSKFDEVFRVLKDKLPRDLVLNFFDGWAIFVKIEQCDEFAKKLLNITA